MDPQTDEEIQAAIAGESVRGPRTFRGRPLHAASRGLRNLRWKVIDPADTKLFHDAAFLYLLAQAHGTTEEELDERRAALLEETDDGRRFRARISRLMDQFTAEEEVECKRLADEIEAEVKQAEVAIVEKKREAVGEPAGPLPIAMPSISATSAPSPTAPTS